MSSSEASSSSEESSSAPVVSSSSEVSSSSSVAESSSSSEVASSSSSEISSSSASSEASNLSCDIQIGQNGGYYTEFLPVTILNSGAALSDWSVDIDLGGTPSQQVASDNLNGVDSVSNVGQILTISGSNLGMGATASVNVRMNFQNYVVPASVDCIGEGGSNSSNGGDGSSSSSSSSVAPPPPPTGTGPIAGGLCAANTGLGNGSATKGIANVVLDDGTAVHVKGGEASVVKFSNGATVTGVVAVNNGDYAAVGICVALSSGAIHCGPYSGVSTTASATLDGVAFMTTGGDIDNGFCALSATGEYLCSSSGDEALNGAVEPFSHAACGRTGCCVIDANDQVRCSALDPAVQPPSTPISLGASDAGYCVVTDEAKSYCWLTQDFQGVNAGGLLYNPQSSPVEPTPLDESVVAYAGGQFHSCWVTSAGGVICSGGGNTANGAAGDSMGSDVATISDSTGPLFNIVAVNGGRGSACAVDTAGDLYCWGDAGANGGTATKVDLGGKKVRMPLDCMQ